MDELTDEEKENSEILQVDEKEEEKSPAPTKICQYGQACYRNNDDHLTLWAHPWRTKQKKPAVETEDEDINNNNNNNEKEKIPVQQQQKNEEDKYQVLENKIALLEKELQETKDKQNSKKEKKKKENEKELTTEELGSGKLGDRPVCKYDSNCKIANKEHFENYSHPLKERAETHFKNLKTSGAINAEHKKQKANDEAYQKLIEKQKEDQPKKKTKKN